MPRKARLVIAGKIYHLTQRGNYRQNIYNGDNDKIQYLKYFEKYAMRYGLELLAYCLMDNHVHLVVRPLTKESMAKTICKVHQKYSVYFHAKRKKRGHLWQERYYSCLLQGCHIRQAIRYVERNPVRARIVARPWKYGFSSARAHIEKAYKLVTLANVSKIINVKTWKKYLLEEEQEELLLKLRRVTIKGLVLGTQEFIQHIEKQIGQKLVRQPGRPKKRACH